MAGNTTSKGRSNAIVGLVLVGLGGLFLLAQVFDINMGRYLWPFFIIIPGAMFFVGMVLGGKAAGPLAIPGSIVTMVGLLLLYQNTFNHWESWAYAWALIFPTAIGVGLMINGQWSSTPALIDRGTKIAGVGVGLFALGGVFFELLLNISNNLMANVIWPLLLIGAGVYLLGRRQSGAVKAARPELERAPEPRPVAPPRETPEAVAAPKKAEPVFEPLDMTRTKKK